jgi:uncharacterized protein (UPF0216 family)
MLIDVGAHMPLKTEGSLEKWINLEFNKMNQNIVVKHVYLGDMLKKEKPSALTRSGDQHNFDVEALNRLSKDLSELQKNLLKIPITFYFDMRVNDSCYLSDERALEALIVNEDLSPLYRFRDGKLWVSRPIAFEISAKYPTLVQFIMH